METEKNSKDLTVVLSIYYICITLNVLRHKVIFAIFISVT